MMDCNTTPTTPAEHQAIALRSTGMAIANIMKETGLPERRVKQLVKSVPKPPKSPIKAAKIPTPLAKASERVFLLARRKHGIRDYELKDILHDEYGTTWDTSTGCYRSNFNSDTIARVKAKVRQRALDEDCNVIFAMDWIDEEAPRSSSEFLISAASDLLSRIDEYVTAYMAIHSTGHTDHSEAAEIARRKQRYAVEQHLLKLAITGYSQEPVEKLLERTANLVGKLEGKPDACTVESLGANHGKTDKPKYFPEPSGVDHFLDYVEQQGWLI